MTANKPELLVRNNSVIPRNHPELIGRESDLEARIEKGVMSGLKIVEEHFLTESVSAAELKQFRAWQELQKTMEEIKKLPEERRRLDAEAERLGIPVAGTKLDSGKRRWDLMPPNVVGAVVDVLTKGAEKYSPNNWQKVPNARERYYSAMMRHIDAWWGGEQTDSETGLHHLAHVACNAFFLMWFDGQDEEV